MSRTPPSASASASIASLRAPHPGAHRLPSSGSGPLVPLAVEATTRAWVGVVSRSHVQRGVHEGFAQVCHGKRAPLERMQRGGWLVYYSPRTERSGGDPLRAFTALGIVTGDAIYPFDMGGGFVPFRRAVAYDARVHEVPIGELARELHFVQRHPSWGVLARRGCFEVDLHDLRLIAAAMRA